MAEGEKTTISARGFPLKQNSAYYSNLAAQSILDLIDQEHACVWPEIEAKLADRSHPALPKDYGIDPHHLTNARRHLLSTNRLAEERRVTRGGSTQIVYGLPAEERIRRRRETKYQEVAARKCLLQARYHGWSQGTGHAPNLIGVAGEQIARLSLREGAATGVGYRHFHPQGAQVSVLFDQPVPIGPLDDATQLFVSDSEDNIRRITILIEVKNLRHWIYPASNELYQLLDKAVQLQQLHPTQLFLPIFICRRAQQLTFWMAKDLGFHVLLTRAQPIAIHSEAPSEKVAEVSEELGYQLDQSGTALPYLVKYFRETLPVRALAVAQQWQRSAPILAGVLSELKDLRNDALSHKDREETMQQLKRAAATIPGIKGNWIGEEEADDEPIWDW